MKTLSKYIPSALIISLLAFILTTGPVFALPGVPTVPPVSQNDLTVPTVPSAPSTGDVPTVPPVPTTPGTCCGQPTSTPQPQSSPTNTPENGGPTSTPESDRGGPSPSGETKENEQQGQVLGLSKTSGEITGELSLMLLGLIIAFFGFRNVLSQKILKK